VHDAGVHGSHMFLSDGRRRPRSASDRRLQCYDFSDCQTAMSAVPGIQAILAIVLSCPLIFSPYSRSLTFSKATPVLVVVACTPCRYRRWDKPTASSHSIRFA
jgi:hypothetical protein